jgi:DNA processing protein
LDELKYWLGFSLIPGIGPRRLLRLREWFGNLGAAWNADGHHLSQSGLEAQPLANVIKARRKIDLDAEIAKVQRVKARIVTMVDAEYPALLRQIPDAPPVLYVRGYLPDDRTLAIVGTRKATRYGQDAAFELARNLARSGVTIVSGLAQGIDRAAHEGALHGGGKTLAVLGCGIDRIYPTAHTQLAQDMIADGAIISEFPIGTSPMAANFPRRNRILSGLSLGVLVIEAPENSGALITASLAAEQGREVFAVPANIFNPMGAGTNRLIQDGAKLVMTVQDVLDELNIVHETVQTRVRTEEAVPSNEAESKLLQHLQADPIHIDELVRLCGLPTAEVSSTLTILELKGLARMVGHMQYSRVVGHQGERL